MRSMGLALIAVVVLELAEGRISMLAAPCLLDSKRGLALRLQMRHPMAPR